MIVIIIRTLVTSVAAAVTSWPRHLLHYLLCLLLTNSYFHSAQHTFRYPAVADLLLRTADTTIALRMLEYIILALDHIMTVGHVLDVLLISIIDIHPPILKPEGGKQFYNFLH